MLLSAENVTEARRSGLASTTKLAAYLFAVYHRPDQRSAEPLVVCSESRQRRARIFKRRARSFKITTTSSMMKTNANPGRAFSHY
jgi:hypothetical protein